MRIKRQKANRKTLQFFSHFIGLKTDSHAQYHVILDGNFIHEMVTKNRDLKEEVRERFEKLLLLSSSSHNYKQQNNHQQQHHSQHHQRQHRQQPVASRIQLYVTRSTLNELQTVYDKTSKESLKQSKQFGLDECDVIIEPSDLIAAVSEKEDNNTDEEELSMATKDIMQLISHHNTTATDNSNNNIKYFVATQDEILLDLLRRKGTVPLIRLAQNGSVLLLEKPSIFAQQLSNKVESNKTRTRTRGGRGSDNDNDKNKDADSLLVQNVKNEIKAHRQHEKQYQRRHEYQQQHHGGRTKTKAKQPNPLSCKKRSTASTGASDGSKPKRKRQRHNKGNNNNE